MRRILHDLRRLLARWWRIDRPRSSPREGRLLRIAPPAIVRVGDQLAEVVLRSVGEDDDGPYVVYRCQCGDQTCQLRVAPLGDTYRSTARWTRGDLERLVPEDEIEVFHVNSRRVRPCGD